MDIGAKLYLLSIVKILQNTGLHFKVLMFEYWDNVFWCHFLPNIEKAAYRENWRKERNDFWKKKHLTVFHDFKAEQPTVKQMK